MAFKIDIDILKDIMLDMSLNLLYGIERLLLAITILNLLLQIFCSTSQQQDHDDSAQKSLFVIHALHYSLWAHKR